MTAIEDEQVHTEVMAFGSLAIQFDDRVLQPRRWTAGQSAWAAELLRSAPDGPVLELCAGVGHIGLLAITEHARPLVLVDANPVACDHAAVNVERAGLSSPVDIRCGRMDEVLADDERFALVIADPPWVPSADTSRYPDDPLIAIDGGSDGLDLARTCLDLMDRHLLPDGSGLLQLGTIDQLEMVRRHVAGSAGPGLEIIDHRVFDGQGVLVRLVRTSD